MSSHDNRQTGGLPGNAEQAYLTWTIEAARIGHDVANFCDHSEHVEAADREAAIKSAGELIELAFEVSDFEGVDLLRVYAGRLAALQYGSVPESTNGYDTFKEVQEAETLRDLQMAQVRHSLQLSPDVMGQSRANQLRHHSMHVSMLVSALAKQIKPDRPSEEFMSQQLPDMLTFGILISTALGERLPDIQATPEFFG